MASQSVDPRLFEANFWHFWLSKLKTSKLKALLHLWVREYQHLFVYLLVLASITLILSLVHLIFICICFSTPLWFILAFELYLSSCWVRLRYLNLLFESYKLQVSKDLKRLCKSSLEPKSKCKDARSLVEASSIMEPSLD